MNTRTVDFVYSRFLAAFQRRVLIANLLVFADQRFEIGGHILL